MIVLSGDFDWSNQAKPGTKWLGRRHKKTMSSVDGRAYTMVTPAKQIPSN